MKTDKNISFLKRTKTDKKWFLKRTKTDKNILFLKRTKRKNNLCRVTGLRGYQGEFTFSGLEDHLFSELRRFRTSSKDELHERELVKLSAIFSDTRLDRLGWRLLRLNWNSLELLLCCRHLEGLEDQLRDWAGTTQAVKEGGHSSSYYITKKWVSNLCLTLIRY